MAKKSTTHLRLRVEERLLKLLEGAAKKNGNTLTGEITARLEQSFGRDNWTFLMREHIDHAAYAAAEKVKADREAELKQLARDIVREMAGPTTLADIGKPRKPEGEKK